MLLQHRATEITSQIANSKSMKLTRIITLQVHMQQKVKTKRQNMMKKSQELRDLTSSRTDRTAAHDMSPMIMIPNVYSQNYKKNKVMR